MKTFCVGCDNPVPLKVENRTCSCCGETYPVMTYHCHQCGLLMETMPISYEHILTQTKKRGIGKTN